MRCLPVYIALELVGLSLEFVFEPAAKLFPSASEDSVPLLASFVGLSTVWALLSNAIRLISIRTAMDLEVPSKLTWLSRINLLSIESLRAMASVMFRMPLLLIPAVVQWVRLAPLPYLVLLSNDYESGRVDALKLTTHFANRQKMLTFAMAILPLLTLIAEVLLLSEATSFSTLFSSPAQHIGSIGVLSLLKLSIDTFLLRVVSRKLTPAV
jgi:hypothetical protein